MHIESKADSLQVDTLDLEEKYRMGTDSESVVLGLDEAYFNCVPDQTGGFMDIKLGHHIRPV